MQLSKRLGSSGESLAKGLCRKLLLKTDSLYKHTVYCGTMWTDRSIFYSLNFIKNVSMALNPRIGLNNLNTSSILCEWGPLFESGIIIGHCSLQYYIFLSKILEDKRGANNLNIRKLESALLEMHWHENGLVQIRSFNRIYKLLDQQRCQRKHCMNDV